MAARPPGQWPRSALGYTARRCGEAGPALGVKGLRKPFIAGVGQRSPRWDARWVVAVSDRLSAPFKRPDRLDVIGPADHSRLRGWMMTIRSASHRVYRQLIVSWSNAIIGIEAKVRRYTGTRCICPVHSKGGRTDRKGKHSPDMEDVMADADLADNGSMLGARRQNGALSSSKAGAAELAGGGFSHEAITTRVGQGLGFDHVRPFQRQGSPCPPGYASRGKRIADRPKEPNGALRGATY